uniref:Uncharacterized protein n=2 Tax=Meloidogyne hapla TaxID=6305 RepID=A0A1I8B614_MELHA
MDSFYVILPSNTNSVDGNTTSNFTVRMPDTLELDSGWTVALSNIIYPFSFSLLGDSDEQESITVFRRYGEKLVSIRIEIPDLSFASEEALEEALNAVLLDTWKKELERERLEEELKREEEENEKRRQELLTVGMVWERKRRAEESEAITKTEETTSIQQEVEKEDSPVFSFDVASRQLKKDGNFDMPKDFAYKFIKYLNNKIKGAQLPDVSLVTDSSIEMVRLKPQSDQKDLIITAIKNFLAPEEETVEAAPPTKTVIQNELSPKEETSQPVASPPSTKTVKQNDVPKQTKAAPETSDSQAESQKTETKETKRQEVVPVFSFDVVSRQLKKDGNFDMPKDLAYKFIKYLNNKIKGAQLPDVSLVTDISIEMVRLKPQSDQKDLFISAIKNFLAPEEETVEAAPPSNDRAPVKHTDFPKETSQHKAPPPPKSDSVKQNNVPKDKKPEAPPSPKSDSVKQNAKLPSPPKDIPKATTPETKITDQETEEENPAVSQGRITNN